MNLKSIAFGFAVGTATGIATALLNKPQNAQGLMTNKYDSKAQLRELKVEANEVKSGIMKTKEESQNSIKALGQEVKTMIADFKADIAPNIDHLKLDADNLKNRGDEIKETFSKK